jgi:hypothetical protein
MGYHLSPLEPEEEPQSGLTKVEDSSIGDFTNITIEKKE